MKVEIKGTIHSVSGSEKKSEKFTVQNLLILVPGYTDEFGDKVGKDQFFQIQVVNKMIDDLQLDKKKGSKGKFTCYLNSNESVKEKVSYFLQLTLKECELVAAAEAAK